MIFVCIVIKLLLGDFSSSDECPSLVFILIGCVVVKLLMSVGFAHLMGAISSVS
jgi:flagellar biosynthesis protein FlhB